MGRWLGMGRLEVTLGLVWVGAGCAGEIPADMSPSITVEGGIEIAIPPAVPEPFDPRFEWEFKVLREVATEVGDAAAQPLVFNPRKAMPLQDGTLLVHDPQADQPLVLLNVDEASVLRRFGRNGQGPGELTIALDFSEAADGSIHVLDRGNRQVHRFASDGTYRGSEHIELNELSHKSLPSPEGLSHFVGLTVANSGGRVRRVGRLGSDYPEVAPVLDLPPLAQGVRGGSIQDGRALWTVVGRNIVVMRSNVPVVMVHDLGGELVREVRLPSLVEP